MTDITIPPEALEKAAEDIYNHWQFAAQVPWVPGGNSLMQEKARDLARAACLAMLSAWPGVIENGHWLLFPHTKLPLPMENSNG